MTYEPAGWPPTIATLAQSLADIGLCADAIDHILTTARPALMLAAHPADDTTIPPGMSKIGGRPDLPPGRPWPIRPAYADNGALAKAALESAERFHADAGIVPPWMDAERGAALLAETARQKADTLAFMRSLDVDAADLDAAFAFRFTAEDCVPVAREAIAKSTAASARFPLAFLAQLDLADLAQRHGFDQALPPSGRLYLFYDLLLLPPSYAPSSAVGLSIFYDDTPADLLVRAEVPGPLADVADLAGTCLSPARLLPQAAITIPFPHSRFGDALSLSKEDSALLQQWMFDHAGWPGDGPNGAHQLGGWPREIQYSMADTATLAANGIGAGSAESHRTPEAQHCLQEASSWRLLFQLGPDQSIGNLLPGALNILLREEDLAAGRFDRAWAVYEQS